MQTLCCILARSGSKGLPGKNLALVGGVSLLARCVSTALEYATLYPEHGVTVAVSSDSHAYLDAARAVGNVATIVRPVALASDDTSSEAAMQHAWETLRCPADVLVLLQCTSPFTTVDDIARCVERVIHPGQDGIQYRSALTVTPFHGFVWYSAGPRGWSDGATGSNHSPLMPRQRRQDRPGNYLETGGVYAVHAQAFRRVPNRFAPPIGLVLVDPWRACDIDTADDVARAQWLTAQHEEVPHERAL